jgi:putative transposase
MVRQWIIRLALDEPALSPRELAMRFTGTESYFVSEASVYRLLKGPPLDATFSGLRGARARRYSTS